MRAIGALLPVAILCVAPVAVRAQAEQPAVTTEVVVAKAWTAMFGDRKDHDIRSLYLEGQFHGKATPSRMTVKRPDLLRNEVASGVLVFDGRRAAWVERAPDEAGKPRGPELIEPADERFVIPPGLE